jgi:pyruvate dehydrogenase E2 component (dihydrolipoamide acetyltransferase)
MATPILMPMPGQMTEECTLVAWHKHEGDPVSRGDVLFEFETDKSVMDVEAFVDGTLLRVLVAEGATVPVNTICAWIGMAGEVVADGDASGNVGPPASSDPPFMATETPVPQSTPQTSLPAELTPPIHSAAPGMSPRAARLAKQLGVSLSSAAGSGPDGRIVERDIQAVAEGTRPEAPAAAAPLGTGAHVQSATQAGSLDGRGEGRPMSRLRQTIARRLTESVRNAPHFAVTVSVDMSQAIDLRTELKGQGSPYTVTDFVLWATAQTLAEFPTVNGVTDGEQVWDRERVHLGVAVSVPGGLVVPVIRDADRLDIDQLRERAAALVSAARAQGLSPDDLSGSTFTVSNMGMLDVDEFTAIINPGESAILAVASIVPTVSVVGDGIGIRQVMRMTLSADHRLVDGELGARFVNAIRRRLEDADVIRNLIIQT